MYCQHCGEIIKSDNISRRQKEDSVGEVFISVAGICDVCGSHTKNDYTGVNVEQLVFLEQADLETILDYDHTENTGRTRTGADF